MPRITAAFCLLLLAAGMPAPVQAEEGLAPPPEAVSTTRMEADDEAGVIRFFVKGQLAAILDETGLHVRKSITGGFTTQQMPEDVFDAFTATGTWKSPHAPE